ncbi:hypothetical protein HPB48_002791 [Haemaphysalis longicornis]|uniref:Uncharacterized protein n=1 Tax=Haemaphysalis longicornis TaxID=44386 RepID=A0A9J6GEN7_HAELO|nr:hypothetical protein HPB48_002791 [Haemaphysalis longicornis]
MYKAWMALKKMRNEEISPMDDLAFDMYVDTEVAQILRKLEAKKRDAIAEERFVFAKKLKYAVAELQKVGEKLGKMVIEKQMAVDMEDFDRARQKKQHIEEYRLNAYEHLRLPELMEMEGVQKLYSKNFIQREEAFKEMQRYLERYNSRRSRHSAEDVLKAVTFLLQRGARDKVLSVFIQALNLMQTLFTRFTIVQR